MLKYFNAPQGIAVSPETTSEFLANKIAKRLTHGYWQGIYKTMMRHIGEDKYSETAWIPYLYKQFKQIDQYK